jgi:hypothetical protein
MYKGGGGKYIRAYRDEKTLACGYDDGEGGNGGESLLHPKAQAHARLCLPSSNGAVYRSHIYKEGGGKEGTFFCIIYQVQYRTIRFMHLLLINIISKVMREHK